MRIMKSRNSHYCNKFNFLIFVFALVICFMVSSCKPESKEAISVSDGFAKPLEDAININTASAAELEKIPYIGEKLALKIVEYREKHGRFRKPEHLMLIQGISDKKFRQISNMVKVDRDLK